MERAFSLAASIITIVNFVIAIAFYTKIDFLPQPDFQFPNTLVRFTLFVFLEIGISFIFSYLLLKVVEEVKHGVIHFVCLSLLGLLSATTSMFNVKWIFLTELTGPFYLITYLFFAAIANLIFALLYYHHMHWDRELHEYSISWNPENLIEYFQGHGIAFMFIWCFEMIDIFARMLGMLG